MPMNPMNRQLDLHRAAIFNPNRIEKPFVDLWQAIAVLSLRYEKDHFLRDGVANLIMGAVRILNADRGRLDGGTMDHDLHVYAERIRFDLDVEKFLPYD